MTYSFEGLLTVVRYSHLEINEDDQLVVRILRGGAVEFGPAFTADEAAKKFWEILGKSSDQMKQGGL